MRRRAQVLLTDLVADLWAVGDLMCGDLGRIACEAEETWQFEHPYAG